MTESSQNRTSKPRDRVGIILYAAYVLMLLASLLIIGKLIYIQVGFKPEDKIAAMLTPPIIKEDLEPARGDILARDGRKLAMSCPSYDIYMDCTVLKGQFAAMKDKEEAVKKEEEWLSKARELSKGLAELLPGKTADQYYKMISTGRSKGSQYLRICRGVDRNTRNEICKLPLFNEGKYKGGYLEEENIIRQYPYGKLARRTIGFIRNNKSNVRNKYIGLEGKFDEYLHGEEGRQWLRKTDNGLVRSYDSAYVKAVDGLDIRTTLDIDYQDIADRALREQIEEDNEIEGGCVILMDVSTGGIRAMVNLMRDTTTRRLEESINLAIGRLGDPGSVFKSVLVTSLLEDGYIKSLDETVPTNHGVLKPFNQDEHVTDYEWKHHTSQMPIIEGLKVSSNYVFRYLAYQHYGNNYKKYQDKIYAYKLGESFDFDLAGLATPMLPPKDTKKWSKTDLGSLAIGYSVCETPLHILTFYNSIANKGKMMKPYLVEDIEKNGEAVRILGPGVLNGAVCSPATAEILTEGLKAVAREGTARKLADAKCVVAGKTGTAQVVLRNGRYKMADGRKKNQGTFVGFFPADDPQFSIIAVVYSKLSHRDFYGSGYPVGAVKTIINSLYDIDPYWQDKR